MFTYTQRRLLEKQRAVLQRNTTQLDAYGDESAPVWKEYLTTPCLIWWDRSSGARSSNRVYVTAARQAPISEGGMLVPLGTDVTEADQIVRVEQFDEKSQTFQPWINGIFQIVATINQPSHIELSLLRVALGAT